MAKKAKKGKANNNQVTSRMAMSTSTLHTPSTQESSEEEEEKDEDEGEQNGSGDVSRKKGDLRSAPTGKLHYICKYRFKKI